MKKLIFGLLLLLLLTVLSTYIFIPSKIMVSSFRYINQYHNGLLRLISDTGKINSFFNSNTKKTDKGFEYKSVNYKILRTYSDFVQIEVSSGDVTATGTFLGMNVYRENSAIQMSLEFKSGQSPWSRFKSYREAITIKESISGLLDLFKKYADNTRNIYGINVREIELKKDTVLISTKLNTTGFPGNPAIYQVIHKLNDFAIAQGAQPVDAPMMHIQTKDSIHFEVMLALPINKTIKGNSEIFIKNMPLNGKMFVTEIKGGYKNIESGFRALELFRQDTKRALMAIPYQLMLNDRSAETDTSKWVTDLYSPINN